MKKLFLILSIVAFAATTSLAVVHAAKGNTEQATEYLAGSAAAVLVAAFQLAPSTTYSLGLQWSRTEENLLEYLKGGRVNPATYSNYATGKLRFKDVALYRSILIDGFTGKQKVWDSTVSKAAGVTNVHQAMLDQDEHVCIDTILVQYANSGGAGTDPAAINSWDSVLTGWLAGLQNSEIFITQDDNPILVDFPVALTGSQADSPYALGRAEGYSVRNPFIIEGGKRFEMSIHFPAAISAANTDFLRIMLLGVGTRKRGLI